MSDYTILIIDYEPRMIESARVTLERAGYKVETAADGVSGIEAFHLLKPALTLIELMLPKKSGLEVCRELRGSEYGEDAPLVIVGSRFRSRQYRNDARHTYKADDFVEKPVSKETLLSLVDALVTGRQLSAAAPEAEAEPPAAALVGAGVAAPVAAEPGSSGDESLESEIGDHLDSLLGF
jgi:two-component system response regulator MtrA